MPNTLPVDSAAKVVFVGDVVKVTPSVGVDYLSTAVKAGVVIQIQDPPNTALAKVRVRYGEAAECINAQGVTGPPITKTLDSPTPTWFEEWFAAATVTVLMHFDGSAP